MLIPCPICGPREDDEFSYLGDATILRPALDQPVDDKAWTDFLFVRDNPKGAHREYWFHRFGCRRWVEVERDTVSHRIASAKLPPATSRAPADGQ